MLQLKEFDKAHMLVAYCNTEKLTKERIVAISYNPHTLQHLLYYI